MAENAKNITNIFSFIPKSVSSEAFLVWLINYLDSDPKYNQCKLSLFDNLLFKKENQGYSVSDIVINRQKDDMEVVLSFHFTGTDEKHDVLLLFGDKASNMVRSEQLDRYKRYYPNCYRYIYYKVGYVTSIEEQCISRNQYELITDGMMESVLKPMEELHPLVKMYTEYLNSEGDAVNSYYERIFLKHDKEVLQETAAQKYLLDSILESNYGNFWNL
jgi:hypothetical protein